LGIRKILQINTVVNYGSTGRIVEGVGQSVLDNGWDSYVAYGRYENTSSSNLIKIGNDWDINYHVIKTRLFDMHGLGSVRATRKLIIKIETLDPDIIHLHNVHGYYINIEVLFSFLAAKNTPVVWTFHDCWPITGHCTYFDFVGCEKWKTECDNCPQIHEYPSSLWFDRSKNNFRLKKKLFTSLSNLTIVPVSKWMDRIVKQSFLNKFPTKIIYNGIDTDIFKPVTTVAIQKKYNLYRKFIILGIASDWVKRKGFSDFMQLSHLIDSQTIILLVGVSKQSIKILPANVIGIPRTDSVQELIEIYSLADVFVNPTWEDNFPSTNLEALACGTPVITYNTGGSPEAIDSQTGVVVQKGDLSGLLSAIRSVRSKGKSYYSKFCIERVTQMFNKKDRFYDYIHLFDNVMRFKK
jgi:glycosyltransferase involved in cell wall biosynthesis